MKLILENKDGKAVRTFMVSGDSAVVISRKDTRRVEIVSTTAALEAQNVKFETLGEVKRETIEKTPLAVADGRLRLVGVVGETIRNQVSVGETPKRWHKTLAIVAVLQVVFILSMFLFKNDAKVEEKQIQQIVQIVKKIPVKQQVVEPQPTVQNTPKQLVSKTTRTKTQPTKTASVKRMGALAVFGSMNNGKQKGGINLGQVNASAGVGLGGKGGSGGMQTTLYGKGLVAAPLGAGSNMQGGGGYGTKGKGGGQAGYGKLSLIGSAGTSTIPLGREALVEGGLDRDLIADVINRNMGQFRFCYEQGLQSSPGLAGRVAVKFTIGSNGRVTSAGLDNSTMNSGMVEGCVVSRMRSLKFPLPEGGVSVKVSYPFMFRRTGQG
ncbi:MAG: AgmX/PglI C-terminal domain-containing protein [Proteobacteria bacterium]|nr:MAG: AgmX/PglI C-terminal domain-containing protein [Pseudomonadota bacterium]